jgi:hypothetical protein
VKRFAALASLLALVACLLAAGPASAGSTKFFESPDHNIACVLIKHTKQFDGGIRCDMRAHSWTSPRPTHCEFDAGGGFSLTEHGRGKGECVSDSIYDQGAPLAAGATARKGQFSCSLDPTGVSVSCVNGKNGHGFAMDLSTYRVF